MAVTTQCAYGTSCPGPAKRHLHAYTPPPDGQRQCRCGTRQWTVRTGGMLPVQVICARHGHPSRINTMYEKGRAKAVRTETAAGDAVPF